MSTNADARNPLRRGVWRIEAAHGVCSDSRREFGRDYRILALIEALDDGPARPYCQCGHTGCSDFGRQS